KFNDLIQKLKTDLLLSDFRTNVSDLEMNLSRIGILSGSGYITEVNNFSRLNYDLIITSDIKWSDWINYDQIGAKVLEVPHLDEQVFVWDVYEQLRSKFPEINLNFMNLAVPYKNIS
ncbi:Nif3-like dinuclear metal center hexameric protein, partial [Mycoplasmopsis pullorum]